jgi:hypothetical protein
MTSTHGDSEPRKSTRVATMRVSRHFAFVASLIAVAAVSVFFGGRALQGICNRLGIRTVEFVARHGTWEPTLVGAACSLIAMMLVPWLLIYVYVTFAPDPTSCWLLAIAESSGITLRGGILKRDREGAPIEHRTSRGRAGKRFALYDSAKRRTA